MIFTQVLTSIFVTIIFNNFTKQWKSISINLKLSCLAADRIQLQWKFIIQFNVLISKWSCWQMKMKVVDDLIQVYVYISIHKYGNAVVKLRLSLIRPGFHLRCIFKKGDNCSNNSQQGQQQEKSSLSSALPPSV